MKTLTKQIKEIINPRLPLISNLSNASAVLNQLANINWCGFYLLSSDRLFLGPFQGEPACTIIPLDKGVCGYAARNKKTVIVDDVNKFQGHIACSSVSKSEIVVPIISGGEVKAVIDIDSPAINRFDDKDREILEEIAGFLAKLFIEGNVKDNHKDEEKNKPEAAIEKLREDYDL